METDYTKKVFKSNMSSEISRALKEKFPFSGYDYLVHVTSIDYDGEMVINYSHSQDSDSQYLIVIIKMSPKDWNVGNMLLERLFVDVKKHIDTYDDSATLTTEEVLSSCVGDDVNLT